MANQALTTLKAVQKDIQGTFDDLGEKYACTLKLKNGSYGGDIFTIKIEGLLAGGISDETQRYTTFASMFKLPPLGTIVNIYGNQYEVMGMKSRSRKVLARKVDNAVVYLIPVDRVIDAWELKQLREKKA